MAPAPHVCDLPSKVDRYTKRAAELLQSQDLIQRTDAGGKPWDLREFVAGNVALIPARSGQNDGLFKIAELLSLRLEILSDIRGVQAAQRGPVGGTRDLNKLVMLPSLAAFIQGSTPLGIMMSFTEFLGCDAGDLLCRDIRDRASAVVLADIKQNFMLIRSLEKRITAVSSDENSEKFRKLRLVSSLAQKIREAELAGDVLSIEELQTALLPILQEGQGAFVDSSYQNVAKLLVSLVEVTTVLNRTKDHKVYQSKLTEKEKAAAESSLGRAVKDSLYVIEEALQQLALTNEYQE